MKLSLATLSLFLGSSQAFVQRTASFGASPLAMSEATVEEVAEEPVVEDMVSDYLFPAQKVTKAAQVAQQGLPLRAVPASMEGMPGALKPMGFWDPCFLSKGKTAEEMAFYREAEIAHGRVTMLAFIGIMFGENIAHTTAVDVAVQTPTSFWVGFIAMIGAIESSHAKLFSKPAAVIDNEFFDWDLDRKFPGDFGFDYLDAYPEDEGLVEMYRTMELQNGRLAMLGVAGTLVQEYVSGQATFGV